MATDKDGMFQIVVDITKIDNKYFLQIGEEEPLVKRSSLKGFGQDVYDYGDIPFVNTNLPDVDTLKLTNMTQNSFTCKCNVKSEGGAIITERGVCWSTNIPTIHDNKEPFGSGTGIFSCTICEPNININTTTYYARAYAINEYGEGYGEPVEINSSKLAYFSLLSFEFGGFTYHIHPDLGGMQWQQGFDACENLVAFGFDDWFMPNKEEMLAIAINTNFLNKDCEYWTSSSYGSGHYYIINFHEGYTYPYDGNVRHVVPVRKDR